MMQIEGIPEGWELVRITDDPKIGEYALDRANSPVQVTDPKAWDLGVIVRKIKETTAPISECPAFPFDEPHPIMNARIDPGMSLRDYFAAKAMASMLSLEDVHKNCGESEVAVWAYQQADAMLAVRSRSA